MISLYLGVGYRGPVKRYRRLSEKQLKRTAANFKDKELLRYIEKRFRHSTD